MGLTPIRVLVVDDSPVAQRLIVNCLNRDPAISVIGVAADGEQALDAIARLKPDVVTLDVQMPRLDGIGAITAIRQTNRMLPVIMLSALTRRGSRETIEALTRGASDYVEKPSSASGVDAVYRHLEQELLPRIKALAAQRRSDAPRIARPYGTTRGAATHPATRPIEVVCIGVSTGGPTALATLFAAWQTPLPVPILIAQHMPPRFTTMLAERLSTLGAIPVSEPYDGEPIKAGAAYLAPGGWHLVVSSEPGPPRIRLADDPPENGCRPSADVLFRSAAQRWGARTLAVVLTGMGSDGTRGAHEIDRAGGRVIAQDEASSVVWGMPGAVVASGMRCEVQPLSGIATAIATQVMGRSVSAVRTR